jgi:hypothetical protein
MTELKLTLELVPNPLWGRSLHKLLLRKEWEKIREQVIMQYNNQCGICGAGGRMICHEIWYYDDVNHIQRLTGFIALCDMCNNCKHMGRSGNLARQGKLDFGEVIDHFCRVNGISKSEVIAIRKVASDQWSERNKHEWTQDFGEYSNLVHR